MGCDIHFYVEIKNEQGIWELAPGQWVLCSECKGTGLGKVSFCANCEEDKAAHDARSLKCLFDASAWEETFNACDWRCTKGWNLNEIYYKGRDYALFGVLSGVRHDATPGFTAEEQGLPPDACEIIKAQGDDIDWHSPGFYTLGELKEYNWQAQFPDFFETMIRMEKLHADPERVRAVFWYDN